MTSSLDPPEAVVRQLLRANRLNPVRRAVSDSGFEDAVNAMQLATQAENQLVFH